MQLSDRELLELAAKACGIKYTVKDAEYYKTHKFFGLWLVYDHEPSEYARRYWNWNPLTDDGDALRLAVKLGLNINYLLTEVGPAWVVRSLDCLVRKEEPYTNDPCEAARRAIVRAAAEIGESK